MKLKKKVSGRLGKRFLSFFDNNISKLEAVFPFLVSTTYLFLFIESYTYQGFLSKIFLLNSLQIAYLTFFVCFIILFHPKQQKREMMGTTIETFHLNRLLLPISGLLYAIFTIEEMTHFPNYVFSQHHINPEHFKYLFVFNIILFCMDIISTNELKEFVLNRKNIVYFWKRTPRLESILFLLIVFQIAWIVVPTTLGVTRVAFGSFQTILKNPFASYEERQQIISPHYAFFAFIRDHTPPDAVIAIPPQQPPWLTSGNEGYVRYYLYPRKEVNSAKRDFVDPSADYAMMSHGEWATDDPKGYGWPQIKVEAEKIWYFDRRTDRGFESTDTVFDPANPAQKEQWGLIKIKK